MKLFLAVPRNSSAESKLHIVIIPYLISQMQQVKAPLGLRSARVASVAHMQRMCYSLPASPALAMSSRSNRPVKTPWIDSVAARSMSMRYLAQQSPLLCRQSMTPAQLSLRRILQNQRESDAADNTDSDTSSLSSESSDGSDDFLRGHPLRKYSTHSSMGSLCYATPPRRCSPTLKCQARGDRLLSKVMDSSEQLGTRGLPRLSGSWCEPDHPTSTTFLRNHGVPGSSKQMQTNSSTQKGSRDYGCADPGPSGPNIARPTSKVLGKAVERFRSSRRISRDRSRQQEMEKADKCFTKGGSLPQKRDSLHAAQRRESQQSLFRRSIGVPRLLTATTRGKACPPLLAKP